MQVYTDKTKNVDYTIPATGLLIGAVIIKLSF